MRSDVLASLAVAGVGLVLLAVGGAIGRSRSGFDVLDALVWLGLGWLLVGAGALALVASLLLAAFRRSPRPPPSAPRPPNR